MNFDITSLAIVYGGSDATNEFFDALTHFDLDLKRGEFPLYFDHGYDETLGKQRIGRGTLIPVSEGIRFDGVVSVPDKLGMRLKRLIAEGLIGMSTGALGHLTHREPQPDGRVRISKWSLGEISATTSPAEIRTVVELKHDIEEIKARVAAGMKEIREREAAEQRYLQAFTNHYRVKVMLMKHQLGIKD